MKVKSPYIVYSLSKGRTTQVFKSRKIIPAWEAIKHFITVCTTAAADQPDSIELTAYTAYEETDPSEKLEKIIQDTTIAFGKGKRSLFVTSPQGIKTDLVQWFLQKKQLQTAIDYIQNGLPWVKSSFGPIDLLFSYSFYLKDLKTKEQLPNQQFESHILIWFSRSAYCAPTLFFPFEEPTKEFWNYVENLKKELPFELEEKYLRLARVNKEGEVSSFKKIVPTPIINQ
jgi:hypothetical protein